MNPGPSPNPPRPAPKKSRVKPSRTVPPSLREVAPQLRWYVWRYDWNAEKGSWSKKLAKSPRTLGVIGWSEENWEKDLGLWGSFEEAHRTFRENEDLQGVGSLIEPERAVKVGGKFVYPVFFDLDECRDPETGEVEPWATEVVVSLDTYAEVSPSGEGIRAIGFVEDPQNRNCWFYTPDGVRFVGQKKDREDGYRRLEIYGGNRGGRHLITFTGAVLEDKPLREVKDFIDEKIPKPPSPSAEETVPPEPLDLPEEEIKRIMFASGRDGELMRRFFDGDPSLWKGKNARYPSPSDADQGFFRKLAFYARGDEERIRNLALSSGMRRRRWNQPGYLGRTIKKGIAFCNGEFYDPNYSSDQRVRDVPRGKVDLPDEDLLRKLAETKGERFERLWEGGEDLWGDGPYEGLEAAQLGLCSMLSFVTGNDEARVDRLFRNSGLYQANWEDEAYRTRTLRKALSEKDYDPNWSPDSEERDSALDVLDEIRLNLPWDTPGGMNACYEYHSLIGKGRIDGKLKKEIGPKDGIEKKVLREIDRFDGEPEVVVEASVRGLMQGSGLYSKDGTKNRRKILEDASLVKTLREGRKGDPSVYLLRSPKHISDKVIPYPTGFVGTEEDCLTFADGTERVESDRDFFGANLLHPLERVGFRRTLRKVPKKCFRSVLNSMACHDSNIKNLVLRTCVEEEDHPDRGKRGLHKDEYGDFEEHFLLHPPSALSAPYNPPVHRFQQPLPDRPMDAATKLKLVRTRGLKTKQKFVFEQIDHGRRSLLELEKFFDVVTEKQKENFRSRHIRPLEKKGLIVPFQDGHFGKSYEKAEKYEQALEEVFTRSGSAEKYEEIKERGAREREAGRAGREQWEKDRKRAEEESERSREFLKLYMEAAKQKREAHG